jgi:hypothetical protein
VKIQNHAIFLSCPDLAWQNWNSPGTILKTPVRLTSSGLGELTELIAGYDLK